MTYVFLEISDYSEETSCISSDPVRSSNIFTLRSQFTADINAAIVVLLVGLKEEIQQRWLVSAKRYQRNRNKGGEREGGQWGAMMRLDRSNA